MNVACISQGKWIYPVCISQGKWIYPVFFKENEWTLYFFKENECTLYFLSKMNETEGCLWDFPFPCLEETLQRFLLLSIFFKENNLSFLEGTNFFNFYFWCFIDFWRFWLITRLEPSLGSLLLWTFNFDSFKWVEKYLLLKHHWSVVN